MVLRELTEFEKVELNSFKLAKTCEGYQVVLAMIAVDLMQDKAYGHSLKPSEFRDCVLDNEYYTKNDPWIFPPLVHTWVTKLAEGNGGKITRQSKNDISSLTFSITDTVCELIITLSGKKYKEMVEFYNKLNEEVYAEKGKYIESLPEYAYRYVVTCIEYMGYKRVPSKGENVVDVSEIPFDGFVQL